jgi:acyl-coenzyme A synthetase/AMP-(fatty) acid ligase
MPVETTPDRSAPPRMTSYEHPRQIHVVDALPGTVSGEIRRSELRQRLGGEV